MAKEIQDQLTIAIVEEDCAQVSKLFLAGAKLDEFDSRAETPLTIAAGVENIEIIDWLIFQGAKINKANKDGMTPLHIAVDMSIDGTIQTGGDPGDEPTDTILCLLAHGAELKLRDNKGKTPLDWACDYKSQKIVRFLKRYSGLITPHTPDASVAKIPLVETLPGGVKLELVKISGGSFNMGTKEEEIEELVQKFHREWYRGESPQHKVTVPSGCAQKQLLSPKLRSPIKRPSLV